MSNNDNILKELNSIKTICDEFGVDNSALDSAIKDLKENPQDEVVDEYNSNVDVFNNSLPGSDEQGNALYKLSQIAQREEKLHDRLPAIRENKRYLQAIRDIKTHIRNINSLRED